MSVDQQVYIYIFQYRRRASLDFRLIYSHPVVHCRIILQTEKETSHFAKLFILWPGIDFKTSTNSWLTLVLFCPLKENFASSISSINNITFMNFMNFSSWSAFVNSWKNWQWTYTVFHFTLFNLPLVETCSGIKPSLTKPRSFCGPGAVNNKRDRQRFSRKLFIESRCGCFN